MARLAIWVRFFESRKEVERNIGRLVIGRICPGNVSAKRAYGGLAGKAWLRFFKPRHSRRVSPRDQARRDRLDIAFYAGNLSREKDIRDSPQLQIRVQQRRCVDIRVPMNLSETKKLGLLKPRNHPQNALLLSETH